MTQCQLYATSVSPAHRAWLGSHLRILCTWVLHLDLIFGPRSDLTCGSHVLISCAVSCVDLMCGSHVWISCAGLMCRSHGWILCAGLMYESHVWISCAGLMNRRAARTPGVSWRVNVMSPQASSDSFGLGAMFSKRPHPAIMSVRMRTTSAADQSPLSTSLASPRAMLYAVAPRQLLEVCFGWFVQKTNVWAS